MVPNNYHIKGPSNGHNNQSIPTATTSTAAAGSSLTAPSSTEESISFITQSFFMCWRALHLGYVQQCDQYYNNLRGLSHFHEGLANDEPRSIHYFLRKLCYDVQLFNPLLLMDIVKFCACSSYVLLTALTADSSNTSSSSSNITTTAVAASPLKSVFGFGNPSAASPVAGVALGVSEAGVSTPQQQTASNKSWLILPESLSATQRATLLSLPEHLIDDIMTILCTIARTEPSYLSTATVTNSLEPVLGLIIFFLRRPWAVQSPHLRAKFGLILFHVFLPCSLRKNEDMWSHITPG